MLLEIIWTLFLKLFIFIITAFSITLFYLKINKMEIEFINFFEFGLTFFVIFIFSFGYLLNNLKKMQTCSICRKVNLGTTHFASIDSNRVYLINSEFIGYKKLISYKKYILIISLINPHYNIKLFENKYMYFLHKGLRKTDFTVLAQKLGCQQVIFTNKLFEFERLTSISLIEDQKPVKDGLVEYNKKEIELFQNGNKVCTECHYNHEFLTSLKRPCQLIKKEFEEND